MNAKGYSKAAREVARILVSAQGYIIIWLLLLSIPKRNETKSKRASKERRRKANECGVRWLDQSKVFENEWVWHANATDPKRVGSTQAFGGLTDDSRLEEGDEGKREGKERKEHGGSAEGLYKVRRWRKASCDAAMIILATLGASLSQCFAFVRLRGALHTHGAHHGLVWPFQSFRRPTCLFRA